MSSLSFDCRPRQRFHGAAKIDSAKFVEVEHLAEPAEGMPAAGSPRMSRMARSFSVGALIAIAVGIPATSAAQAPIPAHIRVLTKSERIMRWLGPQTDVLLVVNQGTTLEVIDFEKEKGWYWVVVPADLHGTRRVGWIRATSVEPSVALAASPVAPPAVASEPQREEAPTQPLVAPSPNMAAAAEDNVAITVRRETPAASAADGGGATKPYTFEDVHFARDQFAIRNEDMVRLVAAATALKDDPTLVVTIEGHTCSLGTGTYNLALGNRRANAVKDYLVSAGVPADRLVTVSQGEANPEFDNSHEETRQLNRRVALVRKVQR
jgi:peptidoglycan-associated lipoprotein